MEYGPDEDNMSEIELPADPRDGVPEGLLRKLEDAVFGVSATDAGEVLEFLTVFHDEAFEQADSDHWNLWWRGIRSDRLPVDLLEELRFLLSTLTSYAARLVFLESLDLIVGEWVLLVTDREKLVGHMVLTHGAAVAEPVDISELELRHQALHRQ